MSRSAFSLKIHLALELARSLPAPASSDPAGKGLLRIASQCLHPTAQLRRMNVQVLQDLRIRDPAISDQAYSLKLEFSREPSSLHDTPPVP